MPTTTYVLSGVTRNARGNPLGNVTVEVYDTAANTFLGMAVSDSGGNYTVALSGASSACFAVGYLDGNPDVAGTTLNDLVPDTVIIPDAANTWYIYGF